MADKKKKDMPATSEKEDKSSKYNKRRWFSPQKRAKGYADDLREKVHTYGKKEGKELTDVLFRRAPHQDLPGKEIDEGYRKHIANDTDNERRPKVDAHGGGKRHAAPQFDQRHHGNQECDQVFLKHFITFYVVFVSIPQKCRPRKKNEFQISVWRRVAADTSGLQTAKRSSMGANS